MPSFPTSSTLPDDPRPGSHDRPDFAIVTEQQDVQFGGENGSGSRYYPNGDPAYREMMSGMPTDD